MFKDLDYIPEKSSKPKDPKTFTITTVNGHKSFIDGDDIKDVMKDFYIHMSDGKTYLVRAEKMINVKQQISQARLINGGFMDVRVPITYKYVTINVDQIVWIEEDDEI